MVVNFTMATRFLSFFLSCYTISVEIGELTQLSLKPKSSSELYMWHELRHTFSISGAMVLTIEEVMVLVFMTSVKIILNCVFGNLAYCRDMR